MERGNNVDPERFVNHYEATGWMRGKNKIRDWRACVRTWERDEKKEGGNPFLELAKKEGLA